MTKKTESSADLIAVKVLRPWKYGAHIVPASQGENATVGDVIVALPESLARQLITDKKAELSAKSKNYDLPKKAGNKPE